MRRENQRSGGTGARQTARGVAALIVTLAMALSFLLPLGARAALAEEALEPAVDVVLAGEEATVEPAADVVAVESEGIGLVAAEAAPIVTETIKLTGTNSATGHTFKGTKFEVLAEGKCDSDKGAHVYLQGSDLYYVQVSSLDGTIIRKVDVHFSRYSVWNFDTLGLVTDGRTTDAVFEPVLNEYDEDIPGEATINPVGEDLTLMRFGAVYSNASNDEPCIDEVTIYYEGKAKDANPMQASAVKATQTLTYKTAAQALKAADVFKVSGAKGTVTYSKKSGNAGITVSSDGKVTVKKGQAVGNYKVVFSVKAAGDATYEAATKDVAVTFAVNKAKNPIAAKAVTRKAKASKVAKKDVAVACPMKVTKAQGKLQYAKVKSGSSKYLTVNKNTGKVTVKKGTKKGTYKIKIKVTAKGTSNYKAGSKTVKCTVKVV